MPQERTIIWRMPSTRGVDRLLRRARLLAARKAGRGAARRAILDGNWDMGNLVRKWMEDGNG